MIKILVTHPRQWAESSLQSALRVEVRRVSIGGPLPRRLCGNISYDGIGDVATLTGIEALLAETKNFVPDVFLFGIHFGLTADIIRRMKLVNHDMKIVMHYTDQRETVPKAVRQYHGLIDLLLVTNNDAPMRAMYRHAGAYPVRVLYDGVDTKEYRPKAIKPDFDCYFGGNNFYGLDLELQKKNMTLEDMLSKFPGAFFRQSFFELINDRFSLVVRGNWGWDKSKFNVQKPLFCPYEVDGMLEAKIILATFNVKLRELITRRILRSLASTRMFLTEYCDGLEEHFSNHRNLVWFKTPEEGVDLIQYYLDHSAERERIGKEGREHVRIHHNFDRRLQDFVKIIREVF